MEDWLYLTVILDRRNHSVVGWACAVTLHVGLVLTALFLATDQRRPPPGLLHHSDRGSQYVDDYYMKALSQHRIKHSTSRRGNRDDDALAESFFGSFETEFCVKRVVPATGPVRTSRPTSPAPC